MIHNFLNEKRFIPNEYVKTFYDIDFNKLYDEGFRLILTDLDNTLIPYDIHLPDNNILEIFKKITEIGFEVVIISNNKYERVRNFSDKLEVRFVNSATKPLRRGFKKAEKLASKKYQKSEIVLIGDQLMTDIWGGNLMGYYTILLDAIKMKTEKWYTKLNRRFERGIMSKINRKHSSDYKSLNLHEKK